MTLADLLALVAIALPLGYAALAPRLGRDPRRAATDAPRLLWGALGVVAALGLMAAGGAESGLLASADPLALIVAGLVATVAAAVAAFSARFMAADPELDRFMRRLLALAACAAGFAFSDHLAMFLGFWVGSGLLLAALIGHVRGWPAAAAAARRARTAFLAGDALLAAGLGLLAVEAGASTISGVLAHVAATGGAGATLPALLVLAGAVARSAILPAHGWLMTSMTAPTPVSALMHAGLVNAGGFVVAKLAPLFAAAPAALAVAFALGAATALAGGAIMLTRSDVKRALAGSTVGQMGFMLMQCGLGAFAHAIFHVVAHGFFKAALFLGAGGMVGAKPAARADARTAPLVAAAGAVAVLGAAALGAPVGLDRPSTLLALFALATGAQAAGAALGQGLRPGALGLLAALGLGCGALYAGGLWAVKAALGDAVPPMRAAGPLEWAGVALFALAWAAANAPALRARLLPPALHVALLNLGRAPAAAGARPA